MRQEEFNRNSQGHGSRGRDAKPYRSGTSRSRSPARHSNNRRRRSRSPKAARKPSFQASGSGPNRQDRLAACPICLGRHRHHIASCQATETWNGTKSLCSRTSNGRILNTQGVVICSDWQRPNRCSDTSGKHTLSRIARHRQECEVWRR